MIARHISRDEVRVPLFSDLFDYIHEALATEAGIDPDAYDFDVEGAVSACTGKLDHVHQFCVETDTDVALLRSLLNEAGANCDCELLLNCLDKIDGEEELPRHAL